jgi:hypothetical protein
VSLYQIDEHAPNALRPGKRNELRVQIIRGARRNKTARDTFTGDAAAQLPAREDDFEIGGRCAFEIRRSRRMLAIETRRARLKSLARTAGVRWRAVSVRCVRSSTNISRTVVT